MRIGLLGTGLIGTSIGLGMRAAGSDVVAWDPNSSHLDEASARGAVTPVDGMAELLSAAHDVVVLASPPHAVIDLVGRLATDSLVMDVAGVKRPILEASRVRRFVGTHPMAGREFAGPAAASASLFRGAAWVVVTDDAQPEDLETVERLVGALGARPVRMTATHHDTAVAAISHLPQLLASALMNEAADRTDALDLVAGSFRDLTRVAASEPALWVELFTANRGPLLDVLDDFLRRLHHVADRLGVGDAAAVEEVLERAHQERRNLGPRTVGVGVALADEPGELARVGRAFERSGVDIRDLQLRHAPYGGGGVLTVSVRAADRDAMRSALTAEGLLLAE
ncbi:MAG: prephenate dehydrogenase/arogenate dehydrogenase family protein [Acidimicrobiia bacterium]|nr:prephenate dehydrogenase/arogenate dehydrogenase family protein [Acidimicrobiia bacterium]